MLINGRPGGEVSALERALQYGDGLFETISCVGGRARWLSRHLRRLQVGCARLALPFHEYAALRAEIGALAAGQQRCLVKVIVSRGPALQRGYRPSGTETPTRIVSRHEWSAEVAPRGAVQPAASGPRGQDAQREDGAEQGLCVQVSPVRLGINPRLAGLKHLCRLEQVLAQLARPPGIDEVLMLSSSRRLVGGSLSNVFLADRHGLFTPVISDCGVAGVMRSLVLEAARELPLVVRPVECVELERVHEMFVTNVRWGVRSVARLDGRPLSSDDYARRLRARLEQRATTEDD